MDLSVFTEKDVYDVFDIKRLQSSICCLILFTERCMVVTIFFKRKDLKK